MRKFKNLQIGDNDLYTKRFGGHDLHLFLQRRGIESKHLVWQKMSEDPTTYELAKNFNDKETINHILSALEIEYSTHSTLLPFSYGIIFDKNFLEADVVHCHLLHNNFFNILHLPVISRLKPLVWTLHDPWALTGHCLHPMTCDRWVRECIECENLTSNFPLKGDLAGVNFAVKEMVYSSCDIDIVVSSEWMYSRVKNSPLLKDKRIHLVPFGLDLDKFRPADTAEAKKLMGIEPDSLVIGLRASNIPFKGFDHVVACLKKLKVNRKIVILTFNNRGFMEEFRDKFHDIVEVGWIFDDEKMIEAYNAVDIFLMPSTAESFGMMAMEAMACGRICVAMSDTALEEVVKPKEGGFVAKQGDIDDFTGKVQRLIDNDSLRYEAAIQARIVAEKYYNFDRYLQGILKVYETAMDSFKHKEWAEKNVELLKNVSLPTKNVFFNALNQDEKVSNERWGPDQFRDYQNILRSAPYKFAFKLSRNSIIRFIYFNFIKKIAR